MEGEAPGEGSEAEQSGEKASVVQDTSLNSIKCGHLFCSAASQHQELLPLYDRKQSED